MTDKVLSSTNISTLITSNIYSNRILQISGFACGSVKLHLAVLSRTLHQNHLREPHDEVLPEMDIITPLLSIAIHTTHLFIGEFVVNDLISIDTALQVVVSTATIVLVNYFINIEALINFLIDHGEDIAEDLMSTTVELTGNVIDPLPIYMFE